MKLYHAFITAGLLCFSTGLLAADEDSATTEQFNKLDQNKDGAISINEATGQLQMLRKWTDIDKNRDGVVEESEFSAFEPAEEYVPDNMDSEDNLGAAPH